MSLRATKSSWKIRKPPCKREPLGYEHVFNETDAERLQHGLIPQGMEDKWFAYFEDGWLHLHRSWTGSLIYWIKLSSCPGGMHVTWRACHMACMSQSHGSIVTLDVRMVSPNRPPVN